jgi:hypothetical protein
MQIKLDVVQAVLCKHGHVFPTQVLRLCAVSHASVRHNQHIVTQQSPHVLRLALLALGDPAGQLADHRAVVFQAEVRTPLCPFAFFGENGHFAL